MTRPDFSEENIFQAARRIQPGEPRQAYLDQACGADAALRARIEALLRAFDESQSFLESPPAEIAPACPPTLGQPAERPGLQIGPYKLLQQIGEGGMGVVYMAEQEQPVRRRVALKIIKPGMDSRQVIARFEAERQALSLMDHPNIAKVLDAGTTESGRPYFVMELVKGQPITQYCDEKHLTPRQRLELLLPVCQAIQHAHQKGIIHRDIKPTNILVAEYDQKAVPKVIDFGVAKATSQALTEKTMFTGFGQIVGTLEYMSPEQAKVNQLDIDTRSDIYSLGVLLYELLTGSTPFDQQRLRSAGWDEMLRIIREEEPEKPSTRLSDSSRHAPRAAHGSPLAPREDSVTRSVTPTLASIAAVRGTEPARLTKLVRGELDWIVMKALEKDRSRRYETANGFAQDIQRYLADEAVQACPPSVGYRLRKFARRNKVALAFTGLVLLILLTLTGGIGWNLRDRAAREREIAQDRAREIDLVEEGIRQALERGTKHRNELHATLKGSGGVQQLLNQPGRWELFLGTASGELEQARRLAVTVEGGLNVELIQGIDKLKEQVIQDQADYDLAQRVEEIRLDFAILVDGQLGYRKLIDEYNKAFERLNVRNNDPAVVADGFRSSPIKDQLIGALDHWAWIASYLGEAELAEQLLAIARHAAPDPDRGDRFRQRNLWRDKSALNELVAQVSTAELSPQLLELVGNLLSNCASPLAEPWLRQAQAEHPSDFWLNLDLAGVLFKNQNSLESVGFYRAALAVRPNAIAYSNLGLALFRQGKPDEAATCARKAIELDSKYPEAHNVLGMALVNQGRVEEARASYRTAIEINPKFANAYCNLGVTFADHEKLDEGIIYYRKALEINPDHRNAHQNLGNVYYRQGKLNDAIIAYRKAVEIDPKFANGHYGVGLVLNDQGEHDGAVEFLRKAIELNPRHGDAYLVMAKLLAICPDPKFRDPQLAVEHAKKAVELQPQSIHAWQALGFAQYGAGAWRESLDALQKSCERENGGTCGQWIVMSLAHWKLANEKVGSEDERTRHRGEARRLFEQSDKQINEWSGRPRDYLRRAIWDFRMEARQLMFAEAPKE